MQVPYHCSSSAGCVVANDFPETNYGNIIAECAREEHGHLRNSCSRGGALAGNPPSPHTLKTPFFPLALYERDRQRAARLQQEWVRLSGCPRKQFDSRWPIANPFGNRRFGDTWQIDEALEAIN